MIPSAKDGAEATEGLIEVDEKLLQEPLRSPSAYEVLSSASSTKSSRASTFSKETAGHIDSGICGLVLDQKGGESPRSCHRTCCQQRHDIASEVRIERAERAGKTVGIQFTTPMAFAPLLTYRFLVHPKTPRYHYC